MSKTVARKRRATKPAAKASPARRVTPPTRAAAGAEPPKRGKSEIGKRPPTTLASVQFDVLDRYGTHPGYGLTVVRVFQIFRAAERGDPTLQCDLFDDVIERDAHLRSQIEMRIEAVAGRQWIIQPGGDEDADVQAAQLLGDALRRVPDFRETLEHMLTVHPFGYAASEIQWERIDGVFIPTWFENVAHRRIRFDANGAPRLVVRGGPVEGLPLEAGRWLFTRRRHRSIPMSGLMRTAVLWSLFKSKSVTNWVLFNERFGLPFPMGTYTTDTPPEEKDALVETLEKIGQDFIAAFHESCKIQNLDMTSTGTPDQVHGAMCDFCDAQISKLFTGGTLTSGEGTSVGSYAAANVHADRLFDLTFADADQRLPQIIEHQVAAPFLAWNGIKAKPPRLKIHVVKEIDPVKRMAVFTAAQALGLPLDADQVRAEMQLKPATGEVLGPAPPVAAPTPVGGGA